MLSDSVASILSFCSVYVVGRSLKHCMDKYAPDTEAPQENLGKHSRHRRILVGSSLNMLNVVRSAVIFVVMLPRPLTQCVSRFSVSPLLCLRWRKHRFRCRLTVSCSSVPFPACVTSTLIMRQASVAFSVFRVCSRCLQIPTTLVVGLYIAKDPTNGTEEQRKGTRLWRLASAFSLSKFLGCAFKVCVSWMCSALFAYEFDFPSICLTCGILVTAIAVASLLETIIHHSRADT